MAKKANKVSDIEVDEKDLLSKAYSAKELVGKTFIIEGIEIIQGDKYEGEYIMADISGLEDAEEGRKFRTGAKNIVARLSKANADDMFPLEVTVIAIGNAFDIE